MERIDAVVPGMVSVRRVARRAFVAARTSEADRMWQEIRQEAESVARSEPIVLTRLTKQVIARESLADSVAMTLARRLANADIGEKQLYSVFRTHFEEQEKSLDDLTADLQAVLTRDPACTSLLHVLLNMKGFHALEIHRVAHGLWLKDRKTLAQALASMVAGTLAVDVHPAARIGRGIMIDHATGVVIGETAVVEDNVSMLQGVTLGGTGKKTGVRHPTVQTGVMIGAGSTILGDITVGKMSKVAAGSMVLKDVPPHCTVAGVPARIVRLHPARQEPAAEMDQSVDP